jgi:hypothetical protein
MFIDDFELDTSKANPLDRIRSREFIDGVLKAGSFISMIENKKINVTTLFVLLLETKKYQDFFTEITASDSFKESILSLLYLHPALVKSKFTKSIIKKLHGKRPTNRTRKVTIQQAPSGISGNKEQAIQVKKVVRRSRANQQT